MGQRKFDSDSWSSISSSERGQAETKRIVRSSGFTATQKRSYKQTWTGQFFSVKFSRITSKFDMFQIMLLTWLTIVIDFYNNDQFNWPVIHQIFFNDKSVFSFFEWSIKKTEGFSSNKFNYKTSSNLFCRTTPIWITKKNISLHIDRSPEAKNKSDRVLCFEFTCRSFVD